MHRYILAPFNKLENQEKLLKGRCFQTSNQYLIRCSNSQGTAKGGRMKRCLPYTSNTSRIKPKYWLKYLQVCSDPSPQVNTFSAF